MFVLSGTSISFLVCDSKLFGVTLYLLSNGRAMAYVIAKMLYFCLDYLNIN